MLGKGTVRWKTPQHILPPPVQTPPSATKRPLQRKYRPAPSAPAPPCTAAPPSLSAQRAPPGPAPTFASLDSLGSANGLFVAADGLEMLLQGVETCAHCVDGDMRGAQVAPALRLAPPIIGATVPCIHLRLDTACAGIATSLPQVAVQALYGLLHLLVRPTQREPAVRQPCRPDRKS